MVMDLATVIGRKVLKAAVMRVIFCPVCPNGHVLDIRDSVLIDATEMGGGMDVCCGKRWDAAKGAIEAKWPGVEVHDGRDLYR